MSSLGYWAGEALVWGPRVASPYLQSEECTRLLHDNISCVFRMGTHTQVTMKGLCIPSLSCLIEYFKFLSNPSIAADLHLLFERSIIF